MGDRVVQGTSVLFGMRGDVRGEASESPRTPLCREVELPDELLVELERIDLGPVLRQGESEDLLGSSAS